MNKRSIFQVVVVCCMSFFVLVGCQGGEDFENDSSSGNNNNKNQQDKKNNGSSVTAGDEFTKILKTGQIKVEYQNQDYGDDGYFQKGLPRNFTKDGSVVIDNSTGLIWQDNRDAMVEKKIWDFAVDYCEELRLAGYSNWRLPTVKELMSITNKSKYNASIDGVFEAVNTENSRYKYWTSQTNQENFSQAYYVDFRYGSYGVFSKEVTYFIRCVSNG